MHRFTSRVALLGLMMVISATVAFANAPGDLDNLRPFLIKHCVACHGPETHERSLRLDLLPIEFNEQDKAASWTKVLDKLSRGEMPPKDEPRPPTAELKSAIDGLQKRLHETSLARQQREGRVLLRRLNRTEYENTLRELLGNAVEVKDLIPDDNSAAGFDNVSAVLDVSAVHLLRYQEAAEKALQTVIPTRPLAEFKERRTGREITEKQKLFKDLIDKQVRLDGDSLILHVRPYGHIPCATATAPQTGRYRVRASVRAVGSNGKPLPLLCSCRIEYGREDNDVRAVHDVPADKPLLIDEEFDLKQRQVIVFTGWTLPTMRDFMNARKQASLDDYTGPGLVVEWVEIEGPLDVWPPKEYQRLLAMCPSSRAPSLVPKQPASPCPPRRSSREINGGFTIRRSSLRPNRVKMRSA